MRPAAAASAQRASSARRKAAKAYLPQPIVVENRPGAQGAIGSEVIARSEPDGHNLLIATSTHTLNKYQLQQIAYDPLRDFTPVDKLTTQTLVLATGASQPFSDLPGLLRLARAQPGRLGFGATEALTAFAGHEFNRLAGVRMEEIQLSVRSNPGFYTASPRPSPRGRNSASASAGVLVSCLRRGTPAAEAGKDPVAHSAQGARLPPWRRARPP